MAIESRNVSKKANFALTPIPLPLGTTATSQTGLVAFSETIAYPFQIVSVEVWATTVTATISVDVAIGATSALSAAVTPVAVTKTAGTLSATLASTRSTSTGGVLNLKYTSNGSGAATGVVVTVWIRPYGMKGDPTPLIGESA